MMRQRIAGGARRKWLTGAALVAAAAMPLSAQGTGNGYLFGEPSGGLTVRAGYAIARANSDFFRLSSEDLTLDKSDFNGPTVGAEVAFRVTPQLDFTLDGAWAGVNRKSHYRDFVDADGREIEQTTTLRRVPLTANVRAYLVPRGRSVGRLAYIPAKVVPWVGVGAGVTWYKAQQSGSFMNVELCNELQTDAACAVYDDTFASSGWGPTLQGMGGVDFTLTPRIALTGDARYLWSSASMNESFEGYDKIDLSGVSIALGLTFRL
jgi:opacity protein-like surface antigen